MPRRGRSSTRGMQREPPIVLGELDTTPTSHHAETLSELASPQDFFEDVIADEDLLALDDLPAPDSTNRKARSFTWSEAGSTRRSSPFRGETPNNVWEFDVDDSPPVMSSPKSGIDKLPATLPLPPQDHIEPKDLQPAERPAHKVDFSETASTARRSTPFGLEEISSQGPWEFETPSAKPTSIAIIGDEGVFSSTSPKSDINQEFPPKMLSDVAVNHNMAHSSRHKIPVHLNMSINIDGNVLEPLPKLVPELAPASDALQLDVTNRTGLETESEEEMLYPSSPQTSRLGAHPGPSGELLANDGRKTRKRKQRAKSPVKFDETTQQVQGSKRSKQAKTTGLPVVSVNNNSGKPSDITQTIAGGQTGKRVAPAPTKAPVKKKPKPAPRGKRNVPKSQTPAAERDLGYEKSVEKPNDPSVTVERLDNPPPLPEPPSPKPKTDIKPIILSSDTGSSEFLPSSPASTLLSSEKKTRPPQRGGKKQQSVPETSKSKVNCPKPQQKTEVQPSFKKNSTAEISNESIQSLTPPSPTTNDLLDKIDEVRNENDSTFLAPKVNKHSFSRCDLGNDSIPELAGNQRREKLVEGPPSGIGGALRNDLSTEGNEDLDSPFKKRTSAANLSEERAVEEVKVVKNGPPGDHNAPAHDEDASDKRGNDKRVKESSGSKFVLKSNFRNDQVADSISSDGLTQHNSVRRPRVVLNRTQSRTLSISEGGSPVRLHSQARGDNDPRYPRENELRFKDLDSKVRVSRLRSTTGISRAKKSGDKTQNIQELTKSLSKVEDNLTTIHTVKSHAVGCGPQQLPVYGRPSSGESVSSRLQEIRGKIRTQMEADLEEQAAKRNRFVNSRVSNSFGDLSKTNETTLSPSSTRGVHRQLHRIVELVSDQLSQGEKRVEDVPVTYMSGMLGALHKIERHFDRERSTLEQDWSRDGELFRRSISAAQDKVTAVQEERDELLAAMEVQRARRRHLYSRARNNLLALNRTLLNSGVALKGAEPS